MQPQQAHHSTQVVSYLLPLVALSLLAVLRFLLRLQLLLSAHYASEQLSPYQPENNHSITRAGWVGAQVEYINDVVFGEKYNISYLRCNLARYDICSSIFTSLIWLIFCVLTHRVAFSVQGRIALLWIIRLNSTWIRNTFGFCFLGE